MIRLFASTRKSLDVLLAGTPIKSSVSGDLKNMMKEFNDIVLPFVKKNKEFFKLDQIVCSFGIVSLVVIIVAPFSLATNANSLTITRR